MHVKYNSTCMYSTCVNKFKSKSCREQLLLFYSMCCNCKIKRAMCYGPRFSAVILWYLPSGLWANKIWITTVTTENITWDITTSNSTQQFVFIPDYTIPLRWGKKATDQLFVQFWPCWWYKMNAPSIWFKFSHENNVEGFVGLKITNLMPYCNLYILSWLWMTKQSGMIASFLHGGPLYFTSVLTMKNILHLFRPWPYCTHRCIPYDLRSVSRGEESLLFRV